jgi:hypothetical protein
MTPVAERNRALVTPLAAVVGHDPADWRLVQKQKELSPGDGNAPKGELARAFGRVLKIDLVQPERGLGRRWGFASFRRRRPFRRAIARARKRRAKPKGQKSETKRHDTDTIALHSIFLTHSPDVTRGPRQKNVKPPRIEAETSEFAASPPSE